MNWRAEALRQQLDALLPGIRVELVATTGSTNSDLLQQARAACSGASPQAAVQRRPSVESAAFARAAPQPAACLRIAEHQTGGRGRQGRGWQSARGASLTFSLALPLAAADWSGLSLAVGVALADALEAPAATPPRIGLKWPNDLWLMDRGADAQASGRKLGGILIETVALGARRLAIIGVGINVRPLDAGAASSGFACLQELDAGASAPAALERIALPLVRALRQFEQIGFAGFCARFAARDLLRGRPVRTTQHGAVDGIAQGVADDGCLLLATARGLQRIASGEVSVRLGSNDARGADGANGANSAAPC